VDKQQGKLFIVSGPSGVGKTTLVTKFLEQSQHLFSIDRVVTYTTKQPRSGDVHGVDYHFVEQSDFDTKVEQGFFLEQSGEYGASYGTPLHIMYEIAGGSSKILVIDRVGAAQIVKKHPHAILVWIEVSSLSVLSDRLLARRTESFEQIQTRLFLAKKEIEEEKNLPMYHHCIENDQLDVAVQGLFDLIALYCRPVK
jgi:guanylate kinase